MVNVNKGGQLRNCPHQFTRGNSGQAALIMILIAAMALTFYAIELNWSRIANLKARTWMAATSAASSVASNFASIGEQVLQQQFIPLDASDGPKYYNSGKIRKWDRTWLPLKILVLVVVVVIIIFVAIVSAPFTGGASLVFLPYVLALVIGMFIASMILEYAVITPGELDMWNKLQQNMQPLDRFRESGISTGLSGIVGDTVNIPDRFDMNGNGLWGFDFDTSASRPVAKDNISRFNFYYTERLKTISPPDTSAITAFLQALNNLMTNPSSADPIQPGGLGFTPLCTDQNRAPPFCDPQCTGIGSRAAVYGNLGWGYRTGTPQYQGAPYGNLGWKDYVPPACFQSPACQPLCFDPSQGSPSSPCCQGPLLYDPSMQESNAPVAAQPGGPPAPLLSRLGHDDEWGKNLLAGANHDKDDPQQRDYNPQNLSGVVFPMLSEMDHIGVGTAFPVFNPPIGLPSQTDSAAAMQHFKALDTNSTTGTRSCAEGADFSQGFYWKPGADRYCSGTVQDQAYYVNRQSEYDRLSPPHGNVYFSSPTLSHFPYYDCTYMHDTSGNRVPCAQADKSLHPKANWPQDRLDDMVYGLHDLVVLNKFLQGQSADTVDQWYPQVAAFIAPQCCAGPACTTSNNCKIGDKNAACQNNPFANNPLTCNPNRPGSLVLFRDEAASWSTLMTTWLQSSFGDSSQDMCYGPLSQIVDCLSNDWRKNGRSSYLSDLTDCSKSLPEGLSTKFPYTLSTACTHVISRAAATPVLFIPSLSTLSPDITVDTTSISSQTVLTQFSTWVQTNISWKTTVSDRHDALSSLLNDAQQVQTLFQEAHTDFDAFLNGPAWNFMQAYLNKATSLDRLPPFAIYGWRDKQGKGNWHLARVEVVQPTHLPRLKTWEDFCVGFDWTAIFLGPVDICNYYQFTDGAGKAWLRVTRWDQGSVGQGGLAKFANSIPIWRFRYTNPNVTSSGDPAKGIEYNCSTGDGIGMTSNTQTALQQFKGNSPMSSQPPLTPDEKDSYQGAFMINIDPRAALPQPPYTGHCTPDSNCDTTSCCTAFYSSFYYLDPSTRLSPQNLINGCVQYNHKLCETNHKLESTIDQTAKCFKVVDPLFNQGVSSIAGAGFGVPYARRQENYHEQVYFNNARGNPFDKDWKDKSYGDGTF